MTTYDAVLFDLDGTLTFPKKGIINAVDYALTGCGVDEPDKDRLTRFIGPPLIGEFQSAYGLTRTQAEGCVACFREYYTTKGIFECDIVPSAEGLLKDLKAAGVPMYVATGKPTPLAEIVLGHFGLADYFEAVVGSNLDNTRTHKYEIIGAALPQVRGNNPVMIGDREHDVEGARKNGIDCIAVTYGYGERSVLQSYSPTHLADTVGEVKRIILP